MTTIQIHNDSRFTSREILQRRFTDSLCDFDSLKKRFTEVLQTFHALLRMLLKTSVRGGTLV